MLSQARYVNAGFVHIHRLSFAHCASVCESAKPFVLSMATRFVYNKHLALPLFIPDNDESYALPDNHGSGKHSESASRSFKMTLPLHTSSFPPHPFQPWRPRLHRLLQRRISSPPSAPRPSPLACLSHLTRVATKTHLPRSGSATWVPAISWLTFVSRSMTRLSTRQSARASIRRAAPAMWN